MADSWEEAAKKYAAKPASADAKEAAGGSVWDASPVNLNPGSPSEAVGRFASNMASAMNPVPGIKAIATDPQGLKHGIEENVFRPQMDQFGKAADAAQGKGEFEGMGPIGRASEAFGHGLAGALPMVGPSAANAGDQIGSGDVAGGLGSAAGLLATTGVPTDNPLKAFKTGSVRSIGLPDVVRATGRGLQRAAEPVIENSAGIRNADRGFGRSPGRAALDETKGFRPGTIENSAQSRLDDINAELERVIGRSNAPVSLTPPRNIVGGEINKAAARNSTATPKELEPMRSFLHEPQPQFAGAAGYPNGARSNINVLPPSLSQPGGTFHISSPSPEIMPEQSPADYLGMKRQFDKDFIGNWNPTVNTKGQLGTARQTYHSMGEQLHNAVPESAELDKRASSLIPIAERSGMRDLQANGIQRAIARFAPHTGALVGAVGGYHAGGLPGAVAGIAIPELLADPTVQAAAARGLNGAGGAVAHPATGRLIQGAQTTKPLRRKEDE